MRDVLVAAAIGFAVGFVAPLDGYGINSPKGIAIVFGSSYWYIGPILLLAGWFIGERRPGNPIARLLGVTGAAWLGFAVGVIAVSVLIALQPRGH